MRKGQKSTKKSQLKNNLQEIHWEINKAKQQNQKVKLLAVSKKQPLDKLIKVESLGVKYFGENKVQEAEKKLPHLKKTTEKHFIGHLQTNKIKRAIQIFDVIQTIDSLDLAKKINKHAKIKNKKQKIYCQINIGRDPRKTGFTAEELQINFVKIIELKNIQVDGIMTMLPFGLSNIKTRQLYIQTKEIRDTLNKTHNINLELSMGMSSDFRIAVECGSTFVRIGTKLFFEKI